ncbi:MAG: hypothetical protein DRQ97_13990 [Gammaproteobacteria bacterium]|nr:MAG: hypothetical protein DRQ97_13990 [Gammaproteobacteria bacterium]
MRLDYLFLDGASSDTMAKVPKCSLDTGVAPSWVVLGHLKNQAPDLLHNTGATDTIARIGPFLGDEPSVPAQDSIWRDDGGDRFQDSPAKRFALGGESASLIVGEENPFAARFQLFLQNPVLFDQVGDGAGLLKSYPARKSSQEEL